MYIVSELASFENRQLKRFFLLWAFRGSAYWSRSQKKGTLRNSLLIGNRPQSNESRPSGGLSQARLLAGLGQAAQQAAVLSVMAQKWSFCSKKWPQILSQIFDFRTNVQWKKKVVFTLKTPTQYFRSWYQMKAHLKPNRMSSWWAPWL